MAEVKNGTRKATIQFVNLKARTRQTVRHYVEALDKLGENHPEVKLSASNFAKVRLVAKSDTIDAGGIPTWVTVSIVKYTNIDPRMCYNKASNEDVEIDGWDSQIGVNRHTVTLCFVPRVHMFAVSKSDLRAFSLKKLLDFLQEAFDQVEDGGFDVTMVSSRGIINKILNAYAVYSVDATISYSNPTDNSELFYRLFDERMRTSGMDKMHCEVRGKKDTPLNVEKDGLIEALANASEKDGNMKAVIKEAKSGQKVIVNTNDYPREERLAYKDVPKGFESAVKELLLKLFGGNDKSVFT